MGRKSIAVNDETHARLAQLARWTGRTIGGLLSVLSHQVDAEDGELLYYPDRVTDKALGLLTELVDLGANERLLAEAADLLEFCGARGEADATSSSNIVPKTDGKDGGHD